jgi:hypothetical protein
MSNISVTRLLANPFASVAFVMSFLFGSLAAQAADDPANGSKIFASQCAYLVSAIWLHAGVAGNDSSRSHAWRT